MSSTERSIPHLRDIFSINNYSSNYNKTTDVHNGYYGGVGDPASLDVNRKQHHSSSRKKRDGNKTLTSSDIKTLERHLSMKKTIRKKIMRDLQQMYTDDPNEFKVENHSPEQLKAEVRVEALRYGERPDAKKSDNFLDMLRGENNYHGGVGHGVNSGGGGVGSGNNQVRHDYDYDSPVTQTNNKEKQSFWKRFTIKNKSNR